MKKAGLFVLLTSVMMLCTVCLTCSAFSASEPYCTAIAVANERNGILTLENGQKWYKVRRFENGMDYILTVKNGAGEQQMLAATDSGNTQYIWRFTDYTMTNSVAPRTEYLSTERFTLARNGSHLETYYPGNETGDIIWYHDGTALCFNGSGNISYLKYDAGSDEPFSLTTDRAEAAEVIIYSCGDVLERCITRQPAAESYVIEGSGYPAPVFSVGLSDVTVDSIRWYADGAEQPGNDVKFTAESLKGLPAGVHSVYCQITAHDSDNVFYRERSADAAFVIAKGVVPDSIMTFSDIHEEYELIDTAIAAIMEKTGGYIPALVICSGDFVNGKTAEKEKELKRFFPQMVSHLGGLDAVFVGGNHDSAEASAIMSAAAELGAAKALPAAGGPIFLGESDAVAKNGKNSRYAKSILVYGLNYGGLVKEENGTVRYSYEDVIGDVDSFLKKTAENYHGELVVISAHSGLHVIGLQPESVNPSLSRLYSWSGENMYNVDMSYELAEIINRYAEQYQMDIFYLFGHDHSRNETEMFMTDGDTLTATKRYADLSSDSLTLHFTYAHSGYLSHVIGCANRQFSFLYRDGDIFSIDLMHAEGGIVRHAEIPLKHPYEAPPETTAVTALQNTTQTTAQTTASEAKTAAPSTGDDLRILLLAVPAAAVLLLCRKRKKAA